MILGIGMTTFIGLLLIYLYIRLLNKYKPVKEAYLMLNKQVYLCYIKLAELKGSLMNSPEIESKTIKNLLMLSKPDYPIKGKLEIIYRFNQEAETIYADFFIKNKSEWFNLFEDLNRKRRTYNKLVNIYNEAVFSFPSSIVATAFSFERKRIIQAKSN